MAQQYAAPPHIPSMHPRRRSQSLSSVPTSPRQQAAHMQHLLQRQLDLETIATAPTSWEQAMLTLPLLLNSPFFPPSTGISTDRKSSYSSTTPKSTQRASSTDTASNSSSTTPSKMPFPVSEFLSLALTISCLHIDLAILTSPNFAKHFPTFCANDGLATTTTSPTPPTNTGSTIAKSLLLSLHTTTTDIAAHMLRVSSHAMHRSQHHPKRGKNMRARNLRWEGQVELSERRSGVGREVGPGHGWRWGSGWSMGHGGGRGGGGEGVRGESLDGRVMRGGGGCNTMGGAEGRGWRGRREAEDYGRAGRGREGRSRGRGSTRRGRGGAESSEVWDRSWRGGW